VVAPGDRGRHHSGAGRGRARAMKRGEASARDAACEPRKAVRAAAPQNLTVQIGSLLLPSATTWSCVSRLTWNQTQKGET